MKSGKNVAFILKSLTRHIFLCSHKRKSSLNHFAWLSLFLLGLSSTNGFALSITNINPAAGQVGDYIAITGDGFSPTLVNNAILFNGVPAQIVYADANELDVLVPPGAASGPISVVAYDQNATSSSNFTINAPASPPTITSFTPLSGIVGTSVTINGTNFDPNSDNDSVAFETSDGWVGATITSATQNQLVVVVPDGAITGLINVSVGDPYCESSVVFTVPPPPTPLSILQMTPASGPVGAQVLITGAGFSAATADDAVQFNGVTS